MTMAKAALTQQFLAWVAEAPRSYADAEAWRRSCPHLSIWEDAISDGLVHYDGGSGLQEARLVLTPRRRAQLQNPLGMRVFVPPNSGLVALAQNEGWNRWI